MKDKKIIIEEERALDCFEVTAIVSVLVLSIWALIAWSVL